MSSYFIYGFTRIATKSNLIFTANQPVTLNVTGVDPITIRQSFADTELVTATL